MWSYSMISSTEPDTYLVYKKHWEKPNGFLNPYFGVKSIFWHPHSENVHRSASPSVICQRFWNLI